MKGRRSPCRAASISAAVHAAQAALLSMPVALPRSAVKKVQPVLGGFDSCKYTTQRLWATAPDGVR